MAKTIQISDVPDELYARLEAEAAQAGCSMSEHLVAKLHSIARQPVRFSGPSWEHLRLFQEDLRWAKKYVELILKKKYYRSRALAVPALAVYTAFVVSYSRPFSGNRDRDGYRTPKWWRFLIADLRPDERILHERIIEERDTLVAHTDGRRRKIELLPSRPPFVRIEHHSGVSPGIGDEEFFHSSLSLIERLLAAAQSAIEPLEALERLKAESQEVQLPLPAQ